jgi:hypothetical protein
MENVGTFDGHLEYFTAISFILYPFGKVSSVLVVFTKKSGNPANDPSQKMVHRHVHIFVQKWPHRWHRLFGTRC